MNNKPQPTTTPISPVVKSKSQRLYDLAFSFIGIHLTMDSTVPANVGCCQCISFILKEFGLLVPTRGVSGTALMYKYLSTIMTEITSSEFGKGDIILSVTGTGRQGSRGHIGIYDGVNRILSNDSNSGLLEDYWTYKGWLAHYETDLEMKTHYFTLNEK